MTPCHPRYGTKSHFFLFIFYGSPYNQIMICREVLWWQYVHARVLDLTCAPLNDRMAPADGLRTGNLVVSVM